MKKPAKIIEEHLNRAKAAFLKGESLRPVVSVAEALKILAGAEIHSTEMGRVGTLLRENLSNLNKVEAVKKHQSAPFSYVKGKEGALLKALIPLARKIKEEQDLESLEAMRERKLKIDRALMAGMGYLEKGGVADALENFRAAAELYVDEDALFSIVAEKLQGAGFHKESMEYARRALDIAPDARKACELVAEGYEKTLDAERGEKHFLRVFEKQGENPQILLGMARLQLAGKKYREALASATQALELEPGLVDAQKMTARIKRLAAKAKAAK